MLMVGRLIFPQIQVFKGPWQHNEHQAAHSVLLSLTRKALWIKVSSKLLNLSLSIFFWGGWRRPVHSMAKETLLNVHTHNTTW